MLEERRQHPRLVPSAPMFVSLDASKSGLLLDICAGGIAVASLIPRNLEDIVALEFELPEGCGRISASAEIAWTRDDGHLSGARFVNLDEDSRAQLSRWIGAITSSAAMKSGIAEFAVAESQVGDSEVAASEFAAHEFVEPEIVEPEPGKAEQRASLFHPEPLENRLPAPVETHPVDAYFLEPPTKEHRSEAKPSISDEPQAPVHEEPEAFTESAKEEADNTEQASAKRADCDRLVCEAEIADAPAELPEAIDDSSKELSAENSLELVQTRSEIQDAAPTESIATELAATEIAAETRATELESLGAPAAQDEDFVFVTRSTYKQAERVAEDESEAHMHLERAAVFVEEAKAEDVAGEPAKEWLMRPWKIPRTAGPPILTEPGTRSTAEKSRYTIEIILAVVVLSWALVFLGYQMGSTGVSRQSSKGMDALTVGAGAAEDGAKGLVPSVEASPGLADTRSPTASTGGTRHEAARPLAKKESESASMLGDPGMVLQVGAMKLEDNADSLARELQKKNLPAFVFRHGSDRLYRVAVGPFSDQQATEKAKSSLEKQGLKPILRRWLPE